MADLHTWYIVAVVSLVTIGIRFLPFLLFDGKRQTPNFILELGKKLPYAIMGMLVVYCLKDTHFASLSGWLPGVLGCLLVGILYIWKRNTLLSIVVGTVGYMLLVQFVF